MADVRDRAQIILVTGLTIAVSLVLLTLLLNTVIFTENLASRGTDTGAREAIEFREEVRDTTAGVIEAENERGHGDHGAVEENVTEAIEEFDRIAGRRHGKDSVLAAVNTSSLSTTNGTLIHQPNSSRALTNASGRENWSLASDIPDTRAFRATVDNGSLNSTTAGSLGSDDPFHVELESGATTWTVFVYENASTDEVAVATDDGGGPTERCSVSGSNVTVDLTGGALGDTECDGLDWPGPIAGSYDIAFRNGANATGTYELTLNTSGTGTENTTNLNDGTITSDSPSFLPALYGATVALSYQDAELRYETEVRAAEGEPDD